MMLNRLPIVYSLRILNLHLPCAPQKSLCVPWITCLLVTSCESSLADTQHILQQRNKYGYFHWAFHSACSQSYSTCLPSYLDIFPWAQNQSPNSYPLNLENTRAKLDFPSSHIKQITWITCTHPSLCFGDPPMTSRFIDNCRTSHGRISKAQPLLALPAGSSQQSVYWVLVSNNILPKWQTAANYLHNFSALILSFLFFHVLHVLYSSMWHQSPTAGSMHLLVRSICIWMFHVLRQNKINWTPPEDRILTLKSLRFSQKPTTDL